LAPFARGVVGRWLLRPSNGLRVGAVFDPHETCSVLNCCRAKLGIRGRSTRANFLIDQIANRDQVARPGTFRGRHYRNRRPMLVNQGVRRSPDVEWNGLGRVVRLLRVGGPLPEDSHGATVENAMAEIVAGRLPLARRALNARFPSRASFTGAFRRATGMTPAEYRRRRRNTPVRILLAAPAPGVQIDRNSAEI
jgi:AraC-like DNA-binding protein